MKIGLDAKRAFCNVTGLGNYSRRLIEGLLCLSPEDQLVAFTPTIREESCHLWQQKLIRRYPQLQIVLPRSFFARRFSSAWRSLFLAPVLKKYHLDVYHGLSHELPPGIESFPGKKIVTIHDLIYLRFPEFFPLIDRMMYAKKFLASCRRADCVIAISEQTKMDLQEFFKLPASKIHVVYQSYNEDFSRMLTSLEKDQLGLKYQLPESYLFCVGSLTARKNLSLAINALSLIKEKFPDLHLVIAGQGPLEHSLRAQAKKCGCSDRVVIVKGVSNQELAGFYQMAKIFLYPSWFEGFGIPILEAMASRVPVITSNTLKDSGPGADAVMYISPSAPEELAAAIEQLLVNPQFASHLVQQGLMQLEKFTLPATTAQLRAVYGQ